VLIYLALSRLVGTNNGDVYTGLHPVLMYVALSGLVGINYVGIYTELHPVLIYVTPSGLNGYNVSCLTPDFTRFWYVSPFQG